MPSFDITSEVNWQEVDNAVNQAMKELSTRYDFRGVETEIKIDQKGAMLNMNCGEEGKLDAMRDILQTKLVKRGVSLYAFEYSEPIQGSGRSVRQAIQVKVGIPKDKGKEIIKMLKESKLKVNAKIQQEMIRVNGNKKDDLQSAIALLKGKEDELKTNMQYGNFRE